MQENQQQGTTSWQFTNYAKATKHEIEGYASETSVDQGGQIQFMVSLSANAQYNMDVYRLGWYPHGTNPDGTSCAPSCGGRLMQHVGPLSGFTQPSCPQDATATDPTYGMTECQWTPTYTLNVPTSWTTGVYLVKLTRLDDGLQNYMTFVVRDDSDNAPVVYSLDVNTWQAYNFWGGAGNNDTGITLYGRINDVTMQDLPGSRAYTVSFDRPYMDQGSEDGAGNLMDWDFPLIRWMESQGYNTDYVTDVDLETNPALLLNHRVFVNTGHDEYYSDNMRNGIKNAIAGGVNMAFFSANDIYQRVVFQSDYAGAADRRIFDDKGALPGSTTYEWRYLTPEQPENSILGVMQNGVATARPFLVSDANSWIYAGTGLVNYTGNGTTGVVTSGPGQNALPGLVGYEFDERAANASSLSPYVPSEPAGIDQVGHSFVPASDNGVNAWSDATLYTAPSGATVFAAGTIQWAFAVDNGYNDGWCDCGSNVASPIGQRITANILNRLSAPLTAPAVTLAPSALTFGSQPVGSTSANQSVTLTNSGNAPLSISNIAVAGTNSGDFAQSDSCPVGTGTLAAGSSCTISVLFAPSAAGVRAASLQVTDNASDSPESVSLSGPGTAPAVGLTPAALSFGSQLVGSTSGTQPVTLTNTGAAPLAISNIAVTGANAGDFVESNNCPGASSSLAANATCSILISFAPSVAGSRSANVQITDNAGDSPENVALTGTGVPLAPAVSMSPSSLPFGSQPVGSTSANQSVTLTNSGNAPLSISNIALAGANAGDFAQTNTCPVGTGTLAAGSSCTIAVAFSPGASGVRSASLQLTDNAGDSPQSVALSGSGAAPAVSLTPSSLGFGSQLIGNTSAAQSVTLTNSGTASLSLSNITVAGANAGDFAQTNNCPSAPATLATGATCSISVTFAPTASGSRSANVQITDNAGDSPESVALTGTGAIPAPAVSLSPSSLTFGSQLVGSTSSSQSVTLTNSGTAPLSLSNIALAGANAGDFAQTNNCPAAPATLATGANCSISVMFTPTGSGNRSASIQISDNAGNSPQSVAVAGTGIAPTVGLAPSTLAFGSQLVGATSSSQSATLTNSGTAPLTIGKIAVTGANAGDFAQTNNCPVTPATLAVGSTCTVSVTFTPGALGSRSASIQLTDNAPNSPQSIGVSGTGSSSSISFDKDLGTHVENVGSTTMKMTTSAAAASKTRVFAFVTWSNATRTLSSVAGGGLTWSVDEQVKDAANFHVAIASASAPTGLPSGTAITATFSGSVNHGDMAAASFAGIAATNAVDAVASNAQAGVAGWNVGLTTSNPNDLVLGWSTIDAVTTSTPIAPNLTIDSFNQLNFYSSVTDAYQIDIANGQKTVNGTWASSSGSTADATVAVAYKAG